MKWFEFVGARISFGCNFWILNFLRKENSKSKNCIKTKFASCKTNSKHFKFIFVWCFFIFIWNVKIRMCTSKANRIVWVDSANISCRLLVVGQTPDAFMAIVLLHQEHTYIIEHKQNHKYKTNVYLKICFKFKTNANCNSLHDPDLYRFCTSAWIFYKNLILNCYHNELHFEYICKSKLLSFISKIEKCKFADATWVHAYLPLC